VSALNQCRLFAHLSAEDAEDRIAEIPHRHRSFAEGEIIAFKGDAYEELFILLKGTLSAEISDIRGRVLKVETLKAPTMVAAGIVFAERSILPVRLTATEPGTLLILPRSSLIDLAQRDSRILMGLLQDSGNRIRFLADKLRFVQMNSLEEKIAIYFTEQAEFQGRPVIELPYSIEALSELFGVTRPALSRSIGRLVDDGVLERRGRAFRIVDAEELRGRTGD